MQEDDQSYYVRRAEAELKMAQKAAGGEAVRAHYMLAGHYLDRAYRGGAGEPSRTQEIARRQMIVQ